ncbi:hypothetical protein BH20VER1_BH20VER1_15570 [soil metagenome]
MNTKTISAAVLLLVLAGGAAAWLMRSAPPVAPALSTAQVAETIESTGKILGLAIGDPIAEARQRLDPLRVPTVYTPDRKEKTGRRIYWNLQATEFDWVMVWGNPEGKITRIRGYLRPENLKPFHEIGDLETAASANPAAAKWTLRRPGGPPYRLIAQGTEHRAQTVYMFSLELPKEQDGRRGEEPNEKD